MKGKLFSAVLSVILLLVVAVSGTFAFFTDSVTTETNTIVAGNLNVELEYSTDGLHWKPVTNSSQILAYTPGTVRCVYLRISNKGNLALKNEFYSKNMGSTIGTNQKNQPIDLADYLQVASAPAGAYADHEEFRSAIRESEARAADPDLSIHAIGDLICSGTLEAGKSYTVSLAVWLPTAVGNEANYKPSEDPDDPDKYRPFIDLGLFAAATQASVESDIFGPDYDAGAQIPQP